MSEKRKGIVDPWRKVEPLHPPPRVARTLRERIDIEDIDRDADLAIPGRYTIRSAHVAFTVLSVRVAVPADAMDVLADCVATLWLNREVGPALVAAGIGVRCKRGTWNVPSADEPASTLEGGASILWFIQKPIDEGMLVLARILRAPPAASTLQKFGVTVMLTA